MNTSVAINQACYVDTTLSDTSLRNVLVTELYQLHNAWLLGWLRSKLGSGLDAADLMHDTFSRLLQKDELPTLNEPRAYLTTIAHGLMVNHVRRQEVERAYLYAISHLPDIETPSAETINIMVETLTKIDEMLSGLSSKVRDAFLWCQLEGLTHAEIAARLDVSVSSVRQYIAKALLHCIKMAE